MNDEPPTTGSDEELHCGAQAELTKSLARLADKYATFRVRDAHFCADMSALGFLRQLAQQAECVLVLSEHPRARFGSLQNARGAFEAAQDLLLLASGPDYDKEGASVRAFEHLEHGDWRAKHADAFPEDAELPDREAHLQEAEGRVRQMVDKMKGDNPDRSEELLNSLTFYSLEFRKARIPVHWTGQSRKALAEILAERLGDPEEAKRMVSAYSHLSRGSHPRLRFDTLQWEGEKGQSMLVDRPSSGRLAIHLAELAVQFGLRALDAIAKTYG